jgi:two-component system, chemotaxis family, protein-glutamate methylesterase/glutaminase
MSGPVANADAFDAVVIGASAGGVAVLRRLLAAVGPQFAPAILIVLHRPACGGSALAEVLAAASTLPLQEALDKQPISPGRVILAPADYHLLVERGRSVALSVDPPVLHSRPAIDPLFQSAAAVYGPRLLALLLTGASRDGCAGVAAVRRHGGTVWVQDPATASAPTMPEAALAGPGADCTLDIDQLCRRLAALSLSDPGNR